MRRGIGEEGLFCEPGHPEKKKKQDDVGQQPLFYPTIVHPQWKLEATPLLEERLKLRRKAWILKKKNLASFFHICK